MNCEIVIVFNYTCAYAQSYTLVTPKMYEHSFNAWSCEVIRNENLNRLYDTWQYKLQFVSMRIFSENNDHCLVLQLFSLLSLVLHMQESHNYIWFSCHLMWNSWISLFYIMHGICWCMIGFFFFFFSCETVFIIKYWNFETYVNEALFYVIILYFGWNINFPSWCKNEHKNCSHKNYSNTWLRKLKSVATYFLPDRFGLFCENIRSYSLNQDFSYYSMKWWSSICHFWVKGDNYISRKRQQRWRVTHFSLFVKTNILRHIRQGRAQRILSSH